MEFKSLVSSGRTFHSLITDGRFELKKTVNLYVQFANVEHL